VGDNIRPLILKRSSADIIRDAAVKMGMRTLREDGWQKVRTGVTTVGEVVRVTQEEV
jgi:type II secretory ATPase GspE/PulE/Tfp pilus assembly ATPase PilB-like protein